MLCYQEPKDLPENFKGVSVGRQPPNKDWTTALIPYFEALEDEYFVLTLEDQYLVQPVDVGRIKAFTRIMDRHPEVGKVDLTQDRTRFPHKRKGRIVISDQQARYRSSLQTALWRKDYFMKFLNPGWTCWDFEIEGMKLAYNDGVQILGTTDGITHFREMSVKGRLVDGR